MSSRSLVPLRAPIRVDFVEERCWLGVDLLENLLEPLVVDVGSLPLGSEVVLLWKPTKEVEKSQLRGKERRRKSKLNEQGIERISS